MVYLNFQGRVSFADLVACHTCSSSLGNRVKEPIIINSCGHNFHTVCQQTGTYIAKGSNRLQHCSVCHKVPRISVKVTYEQLQVLKKALKDKTEISDFCNAIDTLEGINENLKNLLKKLALEDLESQSLEKNLEDELGSTCNGWAFFSPMFILMTVACASAFYNLFG